MTTEDFINKKTNGVLTLVSDLADSTDELKPDEYFALMVVGNTSAENYRRSGYDVNVNPIHHSVDVGVECTSKPERYYISKKFARRKDFSRGRTIIVKVNDLSRCCELNY